MKALEGIKVLDLTHAHAGPISTMFMGAMGAEVIKIEPPWGELNRIFPPLVKGVSPYFAFLGRCKKGVTLDLKHPRGKEMFKEMVRKADVVMENFSPGTLDRLGLGWETLMEINPGIILASISGFGQTGPWRDRRSFDSVAQAASGYMWLMKDDIDPNGPPHKAADAIADTIPGLIALIGILAALNHKHLTGKGQRIDVSQMDAMIAVMQSFSFWNLAKTTFGRVYDNRVDPAFGLHRAKNGYVMFMAPEGRLSDWFRELLGIEELERKIVEEWVSERTVEDVVETLAETGIPVAPVMDLGEVMRNEHALHREMFVRVDHPTIGETTLPGFPIKFSETVGDITTPAPLLGQHNAEVYRELLDLTEEELEELRREGVI
ncbi:MAG: CoA transferase [Candidatus Bathyarchaeota archaeon]|nr:MAG: CoA transferase [Candidatus Bathyarchaeota archaeon]